MFQCFPDSGFYTIRELETRYQFEYNPILFLKQPRTAEIQQRGLAQLKQGRVSKDSQEMGKRWINRIEDAYIPNVSIRFLNERLGHGLFSEENLDAGCFVGEYTGQVRKNDRRYFEPLNNYCYEYPVLDSIGRSFVIDATNGNVTRFINHSLTRI